MTIPRIAAPTEVERRRQALLELDRQRKREANGWLSPNERRSLTAKKNAEKKRAILDRQRRDYQSTMGHMPAARVLIAWHVDETGCRARTVGCD